MGGSGRLNHALAVYKTEQLLMDMEPVLSIRMFPDPELWELLEGWKVVAHLWVLHLQRRAFVWAFQWRLKVQLHICICKLHHQTSASGQQKSHYATQITIPTTLNVFVMFNNPNGSWVQCSTCVIYWPYSKYKPCFWWVLPWTFYLQVWIPWITTAV